MSILNVHKLTKSFGGLTAVSNVTIDLNKGELVGLIGPNGAGKTTVFNLLTGIYEPTSGEIMLNRGEKRVKLNGMKPYKISKAGLARTFQNIRLFKDLSVLDNVRIAKNQNTKYGVISGLLHLPSFQHEEKRIREDCIRLLDVFKLGSKIDETARNLPYGEQRRLEIVRALATEPSLLLLDEPAAGMNPAESAQLTETIKTLCNDFDLSILLIEHDMSVVMNVCERIYVMDYGKVIAHGTPEEIRTDKRVIEAYLGEEATDA